MKLSEAVEAMQEPFKSKALHNMRKYHDNFEVNNISVAIRCAFLWEESPEGFDYWNDYYHTIKNLSL